MNISTISFDLIIFLEPKYTLFYTIKGRKCWANLNLTLNTLFFLVQEGNVLKYLRLQYFFFFFLILKKIPVFSFVFKVR